MFFKTFHRRRSSKTSSTSPASPSSPTINKISLSKIRTSSTTAKTATTVTTAGGFKTSMDAAEIQPGESRDFELFMQKARQEDEKREKAALRAAKEMERRKRNSSMDPWASRMGKV